MNALFKVRKDFGGTFATIFEDGSVIPWKPLSLEDYIQYSLDRQRGLIPISQLEDEIFQKCVLDKSLLRQLPFMKAGIISTVVVNIWEHSGPTGVQEFNEDLDMARNLLFDDSNKILHELVQLITIAYPYKPEEVYAMDYPTFLFRLAQSEKKLIDIGYLKEPVILETVEDKKKKSKLGRIPQNEPPKIPPGDAKKLWDEQRKQFEPEPIKKEQRLKASEVKTDEKWWSISPILEAPRQDHGIDFQTESAEQFTFGATGHEKADIAISRAKLVEDAKWIYADLLKELAARKKGQ